MLKRSVLVLVMLELAPPSLMSADMPPEPPSAAELVQGVIDL